MCTYCLISVMNLKSFTFENGSGTEISGCQYFQTSSIACLRHEAFSDPNVQRPMKLAPNERLYSMLKLHYVGIANR